MCLGCFLKADTICKMNIFDIFHTNEYESVPVLMHNGKSVTLGEFKTVVLRACSFFNDKKLEDVIITSEDTFDFTVWFFACIYMNKNIFLLTDSSRLRYLDFDYIKLDKFDIQMPVSTSACKRFDFQKPDFQNTFVNFFTSGSGSEPKMIKKSLQNLINEGLDIFESFKEFFGENHRVVSSTKSQHMFPFAYRFMMPLCNADRLIIDTQDIYYPDSQDLSDCVFVSTPSFLDKFKKYNAMCEAKVVFSAGAIIKQDLFTYLEKKSRVIDIYGSTESGTVGYKKSSAQKYHTAVSNVFVSVDEKSQIKLKSPYFLESELILCDIIKMENEKNFMLLNRSDRVLKIQEKRISAQEIESVVSQCNIVNECYCLKSADKLACAVSLNKEGFDFYFENPQGCGLKNISSHLKQLVSSKTEIVPQRWKFLYELPKNERGKIDRLKIEKIFATNLSLPFVFECHKSQHNAVYEMLFPKSCNFFEGHFDGFPILAGVVQLYFANYFASDAFNVKINTDSVKKIKFSKLIKPDEKLKLIFERKDNTINYRYEKDGQICSSGVMTINEKD